MGDLEIYDTTLRDGTQMEGISLSVEDKLKIAQKLDELGIHYIEGGWPGSNPKDVEFFVRVQSLRLANAKIVAFGSTRRAGVRAEDDPNLRALVDAQTPAVTLVGKANEEHVRLVLETTREENLAMIRDSVAFMKGQGKVVFFDAEHFFDGFRDNAEYALECLRAAAEAGADCLVLCDTNGGTITSKVVEAVAAARRTGAPIGIHAHNDGEMAVSNSIAAVQAGATQVHGTINGIGERCGNANLISVIANLMLKLDIECVSKMNLKELTEVSRYVAEVCNMKQLDNQPFVGNSAFAHKAGVHINAILKNPKTYEHIEPQLVGNRRRVLISELSGKSGLIKKIEELELGLDKESPKAKRLLSLLQDMEHRGYHFEAAEASLELLMKRAMKKFKDFFELEDFRIIITNQNKKLTSEAIIKLRVGKHLQHIAALGDGPVNALDNALRKALKEFYPGLSDMHLSDFKVRVLDEKEGTAAKVRVLIQSQDKEDSWWTIGVSENIIEASWQALVDSVEYKLLKDSKK